MEFTLAARLRSHPIASRLSCQVPVFATVLVTLALVSCSAAMESDPVATGSVTEVKGVAALTPDKASDWDAVKRTMARSAAPGPKERVGWANTDTGNTGTISDVIASSADGRNCRNFSTTLSSVDGVRLYKAELCRERAGGWEYTRVEPFEDTAPKPKS
jgi:hypothetical protein